MKNVVGQTPRGADFYPRETIISRIYRRLESGNHLYLSAPRRSGKTTIMRAMEDAPREGFVFIYLNVEDCTNAEDYFRLLAEELEKSNAQGKLSKLGDKAKGIISSFLDRIKKVKVAGLEIETAATNTQAPSYATVFEQLLREFETEDTTIVIMVDEFPTAVVNIEKTYGVNQAVQFLHANRGLRQRTNSGIRFIYTGSIGLPNIARKLDPSPTINDLNIVEIPPLTHTEGMDLSRRIFDAYNIKVDDLVLDYMLNEIEWLMPFFIQLIIQLLIDETESENAPITTIMVDKMLQKAANHRNNIYFANYLDRLDKTLSIDQSETAKTILDHIANQGSAKRSDFTQSNAQVVLENLEYDGYIHEQDSTIRFNSPILRMWWKKNAYL